MNHIRLVCYILGYIFVFFGLLLVWWKQFDERDVIMASVAERFQQMSDGQTYDIGNVETAVEKASREVWDKTAGWLFYPVWVMIVGAILIDIGARRKRPQKAERQRL
jgi:hypothetical protein